jgi:apolipoprotein N-acyltransferase
LYPALAGALWHLCARRAGAGRAAWFGSLAFASAWALGEWLRGTMLTGFPWLASGYPQVDGPLAGYAPLIGVYGVGWVLALIAALVTQGLAALCERVRAARATSVPPGAARRGILPTVVLPFALALALLAGGMASSGHAWTTPWGAPLSVRLLQGNIPQSMKFEQAGVDRAIALYQRLITQKPADLIVTPETGISVLIQAVPEDFGLAVRQFVDRTGSSVLFGAVGAELTPQGPIDITNSMFGVTPGKQMLYRYDKHHLVPFGEFVPYGFHWFVRLLNIPLGDQSRGVPVQPAFAVRGERVAVDICYEDIFGEEIARSLREQDAPAHILVNASNLGWFGNTVALEQHLQIARMRTLETGRPLVSATNTGITAAIGANGKVLGRLAPFTVGSLDVAVQGTAGRTPYVSLGNPPVVLGSLILLALGLAWQIREKRRAPR